MEVVLSRQRIAYILIFFSSVLIVYASFTHKSVSLHGSGTTPLEMWLLSLGSASIFAFWIWMFAHLISNRRKIKHSILWSSFFLFGSWLGALTYFFLKYDQPEREWKFSLVIEWFFRGKYRPEFYLKVAIVSFVIALFHYNLMESLHMIVNMYDSQWYRNVVGVIYFPFKIFMMNLYQLLSLDITVTGRQKERLIMFARIMRFLYTYILFYLALFFILMRKRFKAEKEVRI